MPSWHKGRISMELMIPAVENSQETVAYLERRMDQLEDTLLAVYASFCHSYGEIDFTRMPSETFNAPYSTHSMPIPQTRLNVTFITTPPLLVIGTPDPNTPGSLRWERLLEIRFPNDTKFVSFRYGGGTGTVEWFSDGDSGHMMPPLPGISAANQTRNFYLAKNEGVRSLKITSKGDMVLHNLAIGVTRSYLPIRKV
jgi:hypothetical protein